MSMAILSSLRPTAGMAFPDSLRERLHGFTVLEGVNDAALNGLLAEADWFSLPGGTRLYSSGDEDTAVFLVVTGSLGVFIEGETSPERLVAHIGEGETVGEMSALMGETHHTTVVALRDSELLRFGPGAFDKLLLHHPRMMFNLLKQVIRRLRLTTQVSTHRDRPKTFAMIPMQAGVEKDPLARLVVDTLVKMGAKAAVLDAAAEKETTDWFNRFEVAHDVVFYLGDLPDSAWTHFCLRQADRVMLIARADETLPMHPFDQRFLRRGTDVAPELLLVHPGGRRHSMPEHIELRNDLFGSHYHVREGRPDDVKRLARFIAGRAVNLVLAGGGARGLAHIGVLKALKEANVPFDYVAGASIGAIVAAGLAMEWDIGEVKERMHKVFVETNPLSDFTLPLIALFKGRKTSELLHQNFGDSQDRGSRQALLLRFVRSYFGPRLCPPQRPALARAPRDGGAARHTAPGHHGRASAGGWRRDEQSAG